MRIGLLEDNRSQLELMRRWIEAAGHSCSAFAWGKAFLREIGRETYDLYIIDWELPDLSGTEVLAWIRNNVVEPVPVLFVTARDAEQDIVEALNRGADDYMVKPVRRMELMARVAALGRRSGSNLKDGATALEVGGLRIDLQTRRVFRGDEQIRLTRKDYELAMFLLRNRGRLLSRGHILEVVWGRSAAVNTRTVDTHMSRLRKKLGLVPEAGWHLSSIYQQGYRLELMADEPSRTDGSSGSAHEVA